MAAMIYMRCGPYSSLPLYPLFREDEGILRAPSNPTGSKTSRRPKREGKVSRISSDGQGILDLENVHGQEASLPLAHGSGEAFSHPVENKPSRGSRDNETSVLAPTQAILAQHPKKGAIRLQDEMSANALPSLSADLDLVTMRVAEGRDWLNDPPTTTTSALDAGGLNNGEPTSPTTPSSIGEETSPSLRFNIWREPGPSPLAETTLPLSAEPPVCIPSPTVVEETAEGTTPSQTEAAPWTLSRYLSLERFGYDRPRSQGLFKGHPRSKDLEATRSPQLAVYIQSTRRLCG
ncbi:hypothetical protein BD413DRAFT_495623 [Trametes elegans]|nr:hypothetical protein BD413DRAFT_495623 [Trametes elegans]